MRRGPRQHGRKPDCDAIVVLGSTVGPDALPGRALARRVALAVQLFHAGHAERVVFSGGTTRPGLPSEAEAAAQAARALGLPDAAIALETRAHSTAENASFVAAMLAPDARVLIVTDDFHMPRARLLFSRHFAHVQGESARAPLREQLRGGLRELPLLGLLLFQRAARGRRRA